MTAAGKTRLLDAPEIDRILTRLAHEIVERYGTVENVGLIGIRTRGEFIASRLVSKLKGLTGRTVPLGFLDVTFYRDDFRERLIQPQVKGTEIPFSLDGLTVILADDVLYTGRTVRAALDEIMDFGRPARVTVAVLVDRGHREMPIKGDFVGKNIPTADNEHVLVRLKEVDGRDGVYLVRYD
ncbi:MAG: bifunctional pyr operon transcriptional regulator/uracil phosphoribosyltransferase PyrR [Fidelibacterota bacterium]